MRRKTTETTFGLSTIGLKCYDRACFAILKILMHLRVLERGKAQKTLVKLFKGILTWVLSWKAIKPPRRRKKRPL